MRWSRVLVPMLVSTAALEASARAAEPTANACLSASDRATADLADGRYRSARRSYLTCVASSCPAIVRRDCVTSLVELDRIQPSFVFDVRDERGADVADVRVTMDGELIAERLDGKPLAADAGPHVFMFDAGPRYRPARVEVLARATEKNRLVSLKLELASAGPPAPPDAPPATDAAAPTNRRSTAALPLVFAGAGLAALATFAYFGLTAKHDLSALENDPCAARRTCARDDVSSVRTRFAVADVTLGVAVVSLGVAAWLWFTRHGTSAAAPVPPSSPLAVGTAPGGATVGIAQRF